MEQDPPPPRLFKKRLTCRNKVEYIDGTRGKTSRLFHFLNHRGLGKHVIWCCVILSVQQVCGCRLGRQRGRETYLVSHG